jgi:hypothetical protein
MHRRLRAGTVTSTVRRDQTGTLTEGEGCLMEYALLGPTGVKVSKICVGTATFGVAPTERDADA